MMRHRRPALLAASAALVVAGGLLYWMSRDDGADPSAVASEQIAELRAEMRDLERQQAAGLRLAARQQATDSSSDPPARAQPPAEAEPAAPAATEQTFTQEEIADDLESRFAAEPIDEAWSRGATRAATVALSTDLPDGTILKKLECRSSLCRVDTLHDSLDAFRAFASTSLLGRERRIWNGGVSTMVTDESDAGVIAVTYIAKEGQSVPALGSSPEPPHR